LTLANVNARDLAANLPAAGIAGRLFFASDTGAQQRDNGSSWDAVGLAWSAPPASHSAVGAAGQIAFDSAGNFYFCYAADSWARIGAAGYSSAF
jgi:hypothetical protein